MTTVDEQSERDAVAPDVLAREARRNRPAGLLAMVSVLATFAGLFVNLGALQPERGPGDQSVRSLRQVPDNTAALWSSTALQVAGLAAMALVATHLVALVAAREGAPRAMRILAVAAPLVVAIAVVLSTASLVHAADTFAAGGPQTKERVNDLLHKGGGQRLLGVGTIAASIALATWIGWTSLAAARVGLLTKFLGYFGAGAAVAYPLVGLAGQGLVVGWLASVGVLLLGWWPGGRGPSWTTGEIAPWEVTSGRRGRDRGAR